MSRYLITTISFIKDSNWVEMTTHDPNLVSLLSKEIQRFIPDAFTENRLPNETYKSSGIAIVTFKGLKGHGHVIAELIRKFLCEQGWEPYPNHFFRKMVE